MIAAGISGASVMQLIPERYREEEEQQAERDPVVSEIDNRLGWGLLLRGILGQPPPS